TLSGWGNEWEEDYQGKHMEVVQIQRLIRIVKEAHRHWCQGEQEVLWLESKAGYSYALLEPAKEYNIEQWAGVTQLWTHLPLDESQWNPMFRPVNHDVKKPSWCRGNSSQLAWNHFLKGL
ncbi:hypothetical protein FRC11_014712, partial [Ceratobasidium sp. 423]